MKLLAMFALVSLANWAAESASDLTLTPGLTLCSDPSFKDCPDVFISIYDPKFCALRSDSTWQSYTFSCQACQEPDVVGVVDGQCINDQPPVDSSCAAISCQTGTTCVKNQCVPSTTPPNKVCKILCTIGRYCKNGRCVPIPGWCNSDSECRPYELCLENKCTDKCAVIKCVAGYTCIRGKCKKDAKPCIVKNQCAKGHICIDDHCIPKPFFPAAKHYCPVEDVPTIRICRKRPTGQDCPSLNYSVKPDPRYCGLKFDGTKADYIEQCEPCKDKQVAAFYDAPCERVPPAVYKCDINDRPDDASCPSLMYQKAPHFCGVTFDGERLNFKRSCEACKLLNVAYYFDVPCHKAPFVCTAGEQCNGDYCLGHQCAAADDCPYDWQTCLTGQCIDKCTLLKCSNCKFGQCNYQQPSGKCMTNADCQQQREGWSCVGFECADECVTKACPAGQKCGQGECS